MKGNSLSKKLDVLAPKATIGKFLRNKLFNFFTPSLLSRLRVHLDSKID